MTRSADVSGLLRVLYGKELQLRSFRTRWAAAQTLADMGVVEGQVVFAGEDAQLPAEKTGLFDARSIQAYLERATGASKTRAEELLALNNQTAKSVADAERTADAPFLASTRARQLPKVAPEVGALLGTTLVFVRDSDGGSMAEGAEAQLFFEPTGVAQLYVGTSQKALALRGKYRLAA